MTKIKNFRINLRAREVARWLKKERQLQVTPELEAAIEHSAGDAKRLMQPAAVYTTLTRQIAEKASQVGLPEKAIALSAIAVSIGPAMEQERQNAAARQDMLREALWAGLQQEALSQAIQFVVRLVQEQAKEEECEMSFPVSMDSLPAGDQGQSLVASLSTLLGVQRIGLELNPAEPRYPPHARLAWLFWTPIAKGTSRRAEPALTKAG